MKQNEPTTIKPLDLTAFKEQLKIVREKKDSSDNEFNSYGTMNAACWIGEHSGSLIKEIERLREDLTRLQDLAKIDARIAANEKQVNRKRFIGHNMTPIEFNHAWDALQSRTYAESISQDTVKAIAFCRLFTHLLYYLERSSMNPVTIEEVAQEFLAIYETVINTTTKK